VAADGDVLRGERRRSHAEEVGSAERSIAGAREQARQRPPGLLELIPALLPAAFEVAEVDEAEGSVATWPTNGGFLLHGYRARGLLWLNAEGVAAFRFGADGPVYMSAVNGVGREILQDTWLNSVLPLVVQARGTQVLHASAVAGPSGVVAVCGASGAGKSTLAAALAERGHEVLGDDALAYTASESGVIAHALPFKLRPRGGEAASTVTDSAAGLPLAAIVILRADDSVQPVLTTLRAAEALGSLMPQAYCFSLDTGKQELVEAYSALVTHTPVYELRRRQEPETLGSSVRVLEGLLT
jgi:hypothetical protein